MTAPPQNSNSPKSPLSEQERFRPITPQTVATTMTLVNKHFSRLESSGPSLPPVGNVGKQTDFLLILA